MIIDATDKDKIGDITFIEEITLSKRAEFTAGLGGFDGAVNCDYNHFSFGDTSIISTTTSTSVTNKEKKSQTSGQPNWVSKEVNSWFMLIFGMSIKVMKTGYKGRQIPHLIRKLVQVG